MRSSIVTFVIISCKSDQEQVMLTATEAFTALNFPNRYYFCIHIFQNFNEILSKF